MKARRLQLEPVGPLKKLTPAQLTMALDRGWVHREGRYLVPAIAGGATSFVQAFTIRSNSSNVTNPHTFQLSANPAASSTIVIPYLWNGSGTITGVGSITDAKTNTWKFVAQQKQSIGSTTNIGFWYTRQDVGVLTTADTISVTMSALGTTNNRSAQPYEVANVYIPSGLLTEVDIFNSGNDNTSDNTLVSVGGSVGTGSRPTFVSNIFGIGTAATPATAFSVDTDSAWSSIGFGGIGRTIAAEYLDEGVSITINPSGATYTGTAATSNNLFVSLYVNLGLAPEEVVLMQAVKRASFY